MSKPFADGKFTGDSRFSGAREWSHLDETKRRSKEASFYWQRMKRPRTHDTPTGEYRSAPFCSEKFYSISVNGDFLMGLSHSTKLICFQRQFTHVLG